MRDHIICEIRRLAEANGGQAPGVLMFTRDTGIPQHKWAGVYWTKWTDALAEAGYAPNVLQGKFDTDDVLRKVAEATLRLGSVPTVRDMALIRRSDPSCPNPKTVARHLGNQRELVRRLFALGTQNPHFSALLPMLPVLPDVEDRDGGQSAVVGRKAPDGWVYLIKSGNFYKVGRGGELERRVKEIRVALPDAATLIHAISTDDPSGIEAYWHRRFADRRANGEWFKLAPGDVKAFMRRKFQ